MKPKIEATTASTGPAGLSVEQWCAQAGFSRAKFYTLPADCKPSTVAIGRRVVVREKPAEWLERMAQRGGVPSREAA